MDLKPTRNRGAMIRNSLIFIAVLPLVIFGFQNCGKSSSGSGSAENDSASTSVSTTSTTGGSGSSTTTSSSVSAQEAAFVAALTAALGPFSTELTALGITPSDLSVLEGTALLNGTLTAAQITQAQTDVDGVIAKSASFLPLVLSAAQITTLKTAATAAKTTISGYSTTSLPATAALLQTADLEIINRLIAAL